MKKNLLTIFVCATVASPTCNAYETETHALITRQAFERSNLASVGTGSIVNVLGLDRLNSSTPFIWYWNGATAPEFYYTDGGANGDWEASANFLNVDTPEEFERCQMQGFLRVNKDTGQFVSPYASLFADTVTLAYANPEIDPNLPLRNWVVRGAIREDDLGSSFSGGLGTYGTHCSTDWFQTLGHQWDAMELVRPLNHFYDPTLDKGLDSSWPPSHGNKKSVDWALGYMDSFAVPPSPDGTSKNTYSYERARDQLYWALTREFAGDQARTQGHPYTQAMRMYDAQDRMTLWATTFRSIGNVAHLLEDTGQPQHTRNDPHSALNSSERQGFEGYVNARVLGVGDPGPWINAFYHGNTVFLDPPPLTPYPGDGLTSVMFSTPVRFFTTRRPDDDGNQLGRFGLADYTNRGFFTGGTVSGLTVEPYPSPDFSHGYTAVSVPCEGLLSAPPQLQATRCTHYMAAVPDNLSPDFPDRLPIYAGQTQSMFSSPPLAQEGIMESVINTPPSGLMPGAPTVPTKIMGVAELDTIANLTIPRAIGYATGLINYFFRGVGGIEITAPPSGVYAILDNGQPHTTYNGFPCKGTSETDGCPIFGFEHVAMQVRNVTPAVNDFGSGKSVTQNLSNGTLIAIARYHRNECYQPDLSGEANVDSNAMAASSDPATVPVQYPSGCGDQETWLAGRSPYVEISKSVALQVTPEGTVLVGGQYVALNSTTPGKIIFDFTADPIPANATDLFFQVVFRGVMGDTTTSDPTDYEIDGIAVGSVDVSEPTYGTFANLTPYFYSYATAFAPYTGWSQPYQASSDSALAPVNVGSVDICLNQSLLMKVTNTDSPVGPAQATQFAAIFDKNAATNKNIYVSYLNSAGTIERGIAGSWSAWLDETKASGPEFNLFNQITVHVAQSNMEDAALGTFSFLPMLTGATMNVGDNFYYSYWHAWGDGATTTPLISPFPTSHMAGANGGLTVVAVPASQTYLDNVDAVECQ